jgi:hypothetical protein
MSRFSPLHSIPNLLLASVTRLRITPSRRGTTAESRVRERERKVTDAINSLENAEVLLNRSMRIKAQQDVLLPLFRYLNVRFYP